MFFLTTGETIKSKRIERDITQSELADMIGVSKTYIYLIESDKKMPSLKMIIKISRVLRYSVDELIGTDEKLGLV